MALSNPAFELWQWGHEGVSSSLQAAVAATSQISAESIAFTPMDIVARPNIHRGVLVRSPGFETVSRRGMNFTAEGPVHFGQAHAWLGMALLYDAAPTGTGPYTWTHTFDPTAAPSVATRTFERRISDGTNNDDDEWNSCVCNSLEISWVQDDLLRFSASGFGRKRADSTLTGSQTLPTPVFLPSALVTAYIDTSWANLGNTQITGEVLSFRWRFSNGAVPIMTADGRTTLDFTLVGHDRSQVMTEIEITMLVDTNSGQYATEQTAAEAGTLRAVELDIQSSGNEQLTLSALAKHTAGSLYELGEQDGQTIVTMRLQEATDGTNLAQAVLINDVASLV